MTHRYALFSPFVPALVLCAAAPAAPAEAAAFKHRIVATEVVVRAKKVDGAWLTQRLTAASDAEALYYDAALAPATMRIVIEKVATKSAAKAIASSLPLVGMFAGANENRMKGRIEIVDRASGRVLKRAKIDCNDSTQFSAADGMLALADIGTSFLPFGGLFSVASDIGRSAANDRTAAQVKLVRGFVMLSYRSLYGRKTYRRFADQRRAAFSAAKAAAAPPAVPVPAADVPRARSAEDGRRSNTNSHGSQETAGPVVLPQ